MERARGVTAKQGHPAYRTGLVYALEAQPPYRVRVQFPDRDNILSWWLPVCVTKTQDDKDFWQPDIGEQVACLMDEHDENGCVLGSVASLVDAPPAGLTPNDRFYEFSDGTILHYNRVTHVLSVALTAGGQFSVTQPGGASILLDPTGAVTINAPGGFNVITEKAVTIEADEVVTITGSDVTITPLDGGTF